MENMENLNSRIDYLNRFCEDVNKISLYNLITIFNNEYVSFKKEYDKLPQLFPKEEFKDLHYEWFDKFSNGGLLCFTFDSDEWADYCDDYLDSLYVYDKNGEIEIYLGTRHTSCYSKNKIYYDADKELAGKYMDLLESNTTLLDLYDILKNYHHLPIVSRSHSMIFDIKINSNYDNFSFNISIVEDCYGLYDEITIDGNFGDKISINLDKSTIICSGDELDITEELCINVLKSIYVGESLIKQNSIDEQKIKTLKNNLR